LIEHLGHEFIEWHHLTQQPVVSAHLPNGPSQWVISFVIVDEVLVYEPWGGLCFVPESAGTILEDLDVLDAEVSYKQ
jgi:hypothetical protein